VFDELYSVSEIYKKNFFIARPVLEQSTVVEKLHNLFIISNRLFILFVYFVFNFFENRELLKY
jgi:hypothetical protein